MSAMAHGNQPGAEHIALTALVASETLDNEGQTYPDFISAALTDVSG